MPDWGKPLITKVGNNEVAEFPLIESTSSYSISSTGNNGVLPQGQIKRIADASISSIAFIKQPAGNFLVREIDYIPDWNYLQAKNFDISKANILSTANDFSGRVIVKKWGGEIISMAMLENGKTIKRGTIKAIGQSSKEQANNLTETEQCFEQEFCVWQQDCTMSIYGDGMITEECTGWYNTGECWMEYWCEGGGDPCDLAGIGCEDPGGDEPDCDAMQQESEGASVSEEISSETVSASATIRTKKYHWVIYKQNQNLWKFTSHESGVHIKTTNVANPWKWQSLEHINVSKEGVWTGGVIDCTVNTSDVALGLYWAAMDLNYTITASAICRGTPLGGSGTYHSAKIIGINE